MQRIPLPFISPAAVARRVDVESDLAWLDGELSSSRFARWSYLATAPASRLEVREHSVRLDGARVDGGVFEHLRARIDSSSTQPQERPDAPFAGAWMGYFAYRFAETLLPWRSRHENPGDKPLAEFNYYPALLRFDHRANTCELVVADNATSSRLAADALLAAYEKALATMGAPEPITVNLPWELTEDRCAHIGRVNAAKRYIASGDIYQANLALAFRAKLPTATSFSPFNHHCMVRRRNPAPFSAYLAFPGRNISSTSPERFFSVSPTGLVETRPIKGTIRASVDADEDNRLKQQLLNSEKDRAENIMIVDLLRNDLSKVCQPFTVKVPELVVLESYEGLHHLVSSVTGQLKQGHDCMDLIAAAFPGGSITGAPKLRSMEIIDELETSDRGVFCGAIGYIGANGAADFNVAIRTIEYDDDGAQLRAGGGITNLSDPQQEFEEALIKASRLTGGRQA
ncbi:MAG: para-aminobenzoate synthetase component I [Alphaproteobacteria bacterium]|nr:MAG: para-aminobenzoate synthetase component I [Caulobacteraceae bacterium]TPW08211.1 MAG: para-aminobenzoate synthetase component I [Alphaproteobacteria bacterium]